MAKNDSEKRFVCYVETDVDMTGFVSNPNKTDFPTTRSLQKAYLFTESEMAEEEERIRKTNLSYTRLGFARRHWFEV